MTESKTARTSLADEFRALNIKQAIAIVGALAVALLLQTYGFAEQCMGFLIIGVLLYMVPHLLKVVSVKVKTVVGSVFVVLAMLLTAFVSGPMIVGSVEDQIDMDTDDIGGVQYIEGEDGVVTITAEIYDEDVVKATLHYGEVGGVNFKAFGFRTHYDMDAVPVPTEAGGKSLYTVEWKADHIADGAIMGFQIMLEKPSADPESESNDLVGGIAFFRDTGADSMVIAGCALNGMWLFVVFSALMYFIILIFSAIMRRSAEKSRERMEADGRLYPQGYGRCKECGAMVLPGEVNCRKCGAYIDVPEELKAHKKDYFICETCGVEVSRDAKVCPKCGAKFDSTETEVVHEDGSVDVSEETFECSECGAIVPANATRCPKCGTVFDEDDE